jgi:excisionase family DNA binding protein
MSTNQFISVRETAQLLSVTEKKVMELVEQRKLQAYRIADKFLRLKKSEVLTLRNTGTVIQEQAALSYTSGERIRDFVYYNDFYIVSGFVAVGLLFVIFYT